MIGLASGSVFATLFAFQMGLEVEPRSQLAVGAESDMQCTGDYDPQEQFPKRSPKTKKIGLIGKPCMDVTNGNVTTGTCQAAGKCKGEQTGGMPPMLPMIPMMMPKMMMMPMPMIPMQPYCPPTVGTTSSSTPANPNCVPGGSSSLFNTLFDDSDSSAGDTGEKKSVVSSLLETLGLGGSSNGSGGASQSPTTPGAEHAVYLSGSLSAGSSSSSAQETGRPYSQTFVSGDLSGQTPTSFRYATAFSSIGTGFNAILTSVIAALQSLLQTIAGRGTQ